MKKLLVGLLLTSISSFAEGPMFFEMDDTGSGEDKICHVLAENDCKIEMAQYFTGRIGYVEDTITWVAFQVIEKEAVKCISSFKLKCNEAFSEYMDL